MERAAKERLIGAVVLVTAAWLLIPVFLDQRPVRDEALVTRDLSLPERDGAVDAAPVMRRETIDLRANDAPERSPDESPAPIAALPTPEITAAQVGTQQDNEPAMVERGADAAGTNEADATEAVATPGPADTTAKKTPEELLPRPVAEPPTPEKEQAAPQPAKSGDGQLWAVQLGSFSDEGNAQRLAAKYRAEGLLAFVSEVRSGGRTLHRVRIGPQATRAESEAVVARLKAQGQAAGVVSHP